MNEHLLLSELVNGYCFGMKNESIIERFHLIGLVGKKNKIINSSFR